MAISLYTQPQTTVRLPAAEGAAEEEPALLSSGRRLMILGHTEKAPERAKAKVQAVWIAG